MNKFAVPDWVIREGVTQFVSLAAPELLPVVAGMSDEQIIALSARLAEEFSHDDAADGA